MKKLTILIMATTLALFICSCGSGAKKQAKEAVDTETVGTEIVDEDAVSDEAASGASNWDKYLDEYEAFVDEYIVTVKKAASGDMNAMTDMMSMVEKAEKLGNQLEKAAGDLTVAQMTRFNEIIQKLSTAM